MAERVAVVGAGLVGSLFSIFLARRVFGADGSASALRNAMAGRKGGRPNEELLDAGYKELVIAPEKSQGLELNALHIWPRHAFMLIALPNRDRSYTCTLFLSFKGKE